MSVARPSEIRRYSHLTLIATGDSGSIDHDDQSLHISSYSLLTPSKLACCNTTIIAISLASRYNARRPPAQHATMTMLRIAIQLATAIQYRNVGEGLVAMAGRPTVGLELFGQARNRDPD